MLFRTHLYCKRNSLISKIDTVLVPQGMEHQAVYQGMRQFRAYVQVVPIPVGIQPVTAYLKQWQDSTNFRNQLPRGIMVIGLGGSLSEQYHVGDAILYRDCGNLAEKQWHPCNHQLSESVSQQLGNQVSWGRGITSDRIIFRASEKRYLGRQYQADIVDMEGSAVLKWCQSLEIPLIMLRVISDSCQQDLPDLTAAVREDGTLQPLILAQTMLKNPSNSLHLIRSSLHSLLILRQLAHNLFEHTPTKSDRL